ncbi:MAG: PQQ-binding-like beta-propeller repeat protein, partial [Endomicrobia bacterium]|nr:PQQ-binding-like beta-propeller repeat protein [Endomicrobiia bacterium]
MKNCITNFVMKQSWIMIMLILITKIVYSASFPIFRADRFRSGKVDEIAVISSSQPSSIWVKEIQGQIFSSPVVKDGVVYFGGRDTSIWALNAYNGEVIWQYSTSGFVDSPPLIHKNFIYLLSTDGKLYCFRLNFSSEDNETPLWTFDTASKSYGSLLLTDNDEIIFVSGPLINGLPYGYVYIVNAQTGQLIQKVSLDSFSYSSVSYYKDNLYFTTNNGTVVSYSLQQKKINWSYQVSSCLSGTTVVPYENKLYFYAGDIESKIFVLDENGVLNSSSTRLSLYATDNTQIAVSSSIIVVNVYPTSLWIKSGIKYSSQTIYAIDRNSLEVKWRRDFLVKSTPEHSYGVTSAPTIANSVIYVGLNSGEFYALDLYTGETLYSFNTGVPIIGSPAVSNGWIYFATVEGKVYGIKSNNFASIVSPDDNEIVINSTTIKILCSNIGSTYEIRCKNYTEEILVSSGNISGEQTLVGFDTKPLLDGKYKLTLSLPAGIVSNNIAIDNSPLPPTNFSALQIETNKILLSWTKSIDDGSGNNDVLFYNIYRSTDNKKFFVVAKVVSGNTYYIDIVDMLGTTYYYKITAEDKNSSSLASSVQKVFVPLITKPQPPTNVNVAIFQHYISSADVILSWSASVDESTNVAKYKVFKSTRSDMFNFIFEIIKTGNTNYYFIDRCIANNTYFYIVISENSYGKTSDTSTVVSIFIPAIMPPQPPRNLTAFDTPEDLGGNITLCWQPSVDENSVVSPVIEYRIYKSSDGNNFVVFYRYNNLGKTSYTFYDTECLTGVTFYYYITAVNNFSLESAHSNVVSAFSIKNTEIIDNTPPEIPSYVAAMDYPNDDGSKILILWSVSKDDGMGDNDVVKYKIYRNYSYLTYLPAGTTWFIDNTVLPNITYFYYLTVLDKNNNESGGTAIISCTALADGIPAKVENFTAEVKSHYSGVYVVLRWDKSADDTTGWNDVDMYIIYRATDNIN